MSRRPSPTTNVGIDDEVMEGTHSNTLKGANESARLTEFLRDFKSIEEQEDIYGDGLGMDVDDIQPKYIVLMVLIILNV